MSEIFVVTSGKGGVGKTTVSAFLGAKLAARGKRTVVCDLDFGLNNLDIVMGTEKSIRFDLTDVLEGRCRASQSLVPCAVKNLYMISSCHAAGGGVVTSANIKSLFEGLKDNFDYILLDCPAGIDVGFHRAVQSADGAIVVVTPSLSAVRDADKTLSVVRSYNLSKVYVVVNMVRGDLAADGLTLSVGDVEDILKCKVIGAIPFDDEIITSENCVIPDSSVAGHCFKNLAAAVSGGKVRLYDCEKKYNGIIGSIKRGLKRAL